MSIAPVPYSDDDLVDAMSFHERPQRIAIPEQLGFVTTRLLVAAQHETDQMKTCSGSEPAQQCLDFGSAGPAAEHQNSALERFVAENAEETPPDERGEDEGKQEAQGHNAASQEACRYHVEDDHHHQRPCGEASQEAHVILAVVFV